MKKVKLVLLFGIFVISFNPVYSQEAPKTDTLSVNKSFDFFFINGYAIGYKFKANENSALRLTLDLRGTYFNSNGESDSQSSFPWDTLSNKSSEDREANNINVALSASYLYYLFNSKHVSIYTGSGPYFSFNNYSLKSVSNYNRDERTNRNFNKSNGFSIGLLSLFGVAGSLNENVNLFAEAQLAAVYQWTSSNYESTENNEGAEVSRRISESSSNGWLLEFTVVRVGMGIYF